MSLALMSVIFFVLEPAVGSAPDIGASLRTAAAIENNYYFPPFYGVDNSIDFISQALLRLTVEGEADENSDYEVHLVQNFDYSTAQAGQGGFAGGFSSSQNTYRALDAALNWSRGEESSAALWLDRFNMRFSFPNADLTIGRQAVTFGKAYFWNPLDVFAPFDPSQFDRDYKPGVDALRYDLYLSDFTGVTLVGAAGAKLSPPGSVARAPQSFAADWYGSALLARYFTTVNGWDYSVQGGKVHGGWQLGVGAVGEVGAWQTRVEAAWFSASGNPPRSMLVAGDLFEDSLTTVIGVGRYYENTLDIELEYFHNGSGDSRDLDTSFFRQQYGATRQIGRHILGGMASYEFDPLLKGQLVTLVSLTDRSSQFQPLLTRSLSDDSDVVFGATLSFGRRPEGMFSFSPEIKSEFGTYPNLYYAEYKIYY
ncbi:MAG: hypothetical protein ABIH66_04840 [bacterium]